MMMVIIENIPDSREKHSRLGWGKIQVAVIIIMEQVEAQGSRHSALITTRLQDTDKYSIKQMPGRPLSFARTRLVLVVARYRTIMVIGSNLVSS